MKYLVFLLMFAPLSAVAGLCLCLAFDWFVGGAVALFLLGLSADVCFFGSEREL